MSEITTRTIQFPYEAQEWSTGQVITQDRLDHIELGIQDVSEQISNATKTSETQFTNQGQRTNRELFDFFQGLINRLRNAERSIDKYGEVYNSLSFKQATSEKSWDSYEVIKNISVGELKYNGGRVGSGLTASPGYYIKVIPLPESQTDYKIACNKTNKKIGFAENDDTTTRFRQYNSDWTLSNEECDSLVGENVSSVTNPIYYIALTASKFNDYFGTPTNNQYTLNTDVQLTSLQPSDTSAASIEFNYPIYIYTGEESAPLWDTITTSAVQELNPQFTLNPTQRIVRTPTNTSWPGRKTLTAQDTVIKKNMDYLLVWIGNKTNNINPQGNTSVSRCVYCAPEKLTIKYNNDQDEITIVETAETAVDPVQHLTELLSQAQQNIINETVRLTDNMSLLDLLPRHNGYYDANTGAFINDKTAQCIQIPVRPGDRIFVTGAENKVTSQTIGFIYGWLKKKVGEDGYELIQKKYNNTYSDKQKGPGSEAYIGTIPGIWTHPGYTDKAPEQAEYLYVLLKDHQEQDYSPMLLQINRTILTIPIYQMLDCFDKPQSYVYPLYNHLMVDSSYIGAMTQYANPNGIRIVTPPLYFDKPIYINNIIKDNGKYYPLRIMLVDENSHITKQIFSAANNGPKAINQRIPANTLFYIIINKPADQNIKKNTDYLSLTYEPISNDPVNWTALGDSITEGYYSFYNQENDSKITFKDGYSYNPTYKTAQGFFRNNALWRPISSSTTDTTTLAQNAPIYDKSDSEHQANITRVKKEDLAHGQYRVTGTSDSIAQESWAYKAAHKLGWSLTNIAKGGTGFADPQNGAYALLKKAKQPYGPDNIRDHGIGFTAKEGQLPWYKAWTTNFANCNLVTIALGINDWKGNQYLGDPNNITRDSNNKVTLGGLSWLKTDITDGAINWNNHIYLYTGLKSLNAARTSVVQQMIYRDCEYEYTQTVSQQEKTNDNKKIIYPQENAANWSIKRDGNNSPRRGLTIAEGLAATIAGIEETAPDDCLIVVITPLNCLEAYPYANNTSRYPAGSTNYALDYVYDNSGTLEDVFNTITQVCTNLGIQYLDMTHYSPINKFNIKQALIDNVHPSKEMQDMLADDLSKKLNFLYHAPRGNYSQEQILSNVYANDAYKYLHFSLDSQGNLYQLGDRGRSQVIKSTNNNITVYYGQKASEVPLVTT